MMKRARGKFNGGNIYRHNEQVDRLIGEGDEGGNGVSKRKILNKTLGQKL